MRALIASALLGLFILAGCADSTQRPSPVYDAIRERYEDQGYVYMGERGGWAIFQRLLGYSFAGGHVYLTTETVAVWRADPRIWTSAQSTRLVG